jgi:hypothetical protein
MSNLRGDGALTKCPKCGSDQINAFDWEGGSDDASCTVDCDKCDFRGFEIYKAVSWEEY